ncbi:hypothetical protein [Caballeronia sp. LZ035]|uniref:hypothetical protein n=1 Tax=Caballeronia sp. LZ035 TaxID=3038568 RepID=UPI00286467C5|nr:hypothetical protein [Caballeronia sp. LZ035]MDR5761445.1 hypothetical protein [Caballeronia sp. LZ035]
MSANGKITDPVTGNASLVRPRFSPGLLLRDDDLNQAIDYTRDLSRLLFRTMFGCGVVCGLRVSVQPFCDGVRLTVGPGVALDCHGDPIHVPQSRTLTLDPACGARKVPSILWVVLRRTDKSCAPRSSVCSCEDDDTDTTVCTRERDCYEIGVLGERPRCVCGCEMPSGEVSQEESNNGGGRQLGDDTNDPAADTSMALRSRAAGGGAPSPVETDCRCADPASACYKDHYDGLCACDCCDCTNQWVVLALAQATQIDKKTSNGATADPAARNWRIDHRVRRFVRPVLMRDPVAWEEQHPQPAAR